MSINPRSHGSLPYPLIWNNCILASIAHAIMVPHFPYLAHEHSWDGSNYQIQDSQGIRGSITFQDHQVVAAFRNEQISVRPFAYSHFFEHAPDSIKFIAQDETLQYLLEEFDGQVRPSISTAFWIHDDVLYTHDTWDDLLNHGASVLFNQIMELEQAYAYWIDAYGMNEAQSHLLISLSQRKIAGPEDIITLTQAEIDAIGTPEEPDEDGMDLCETSFQEIGMMFPK